jgi:hypothetical protein
MEVSQAEEREERKQTEVFPDPAGPMTLEMGTS